MENTNNAIGSPIESSAASIGEKPPVESRINVRVARKARTSAVASPRRVANRRHRSCSWASRQR